MRAHVLLIDGSGASGEWARVLEQNGFQCTQARGPIRVRSVLEAGAVELIVWNQEPGNRELARDLAAEWQRFPRVPVIHLFPTEGPVVVAGEDAQILESLPAEAAESRLLGLLNRHFERPPVEEPAPAMPRSELAFRNVFSTLLSRRDAGDAGRELGNELGLEAPITSVNPAEREHLAEVARAGGGARPWWRRILSRLSGTP